MGLEVEPHSEEEGRPLRTVVRVPVRPRLVLSRASVARHPVVCFEVIFLVSLVCISPGDFVIRQVRGRRATLDLSKLQSDPGYAQAALPSDYGSDLWTDEYFSAHRGALEKRYKPGNFTVPITFLLGLFALLGSRTVILPPGTADLFATVLVQGNINHYDDVNTLGNEYLHHNSEETMRHPVRNPLTLVQEPVYRRKVPSLMEPHGENDLGDGVLPYREYPTDHKRHEDPETRCAEAVTETNLVNPKRLWYRSFQCGVPPRSHMYCKNGFARNASLCQAILGWLDVWRNKKHETIACINPG